LVFRGVSVLAGPAASALERLTGVRATLFVGSLSEAEAELRAGGCQAVLQSDTSTS